MKELLSQIIERLDRAQLNNEVMLYHEEGEWRAEAVNPSWAVSLGEVPGAYQSKRHDNPEAALADLLALLSRRVMTSLR